MRTVTATLTLLAATFLTTNSASFAQTQVDTFYYTGAEQIFVVPLCAGTISFDVRAGQGGNFLNAAGGSGGRVEGDIDLNGGDTLRIIVGRMGLSDQGSASGVYFGSGGVYSYSSGGESGTGGGSSDIRLNGTTLADRIAVAGGGGGAGGYTTQMLWGGAGGGLVGQDGLNWNSWPNAGGKGGTQTAGGAMGIACCSCPTYTTSGSLGLGGEGSGDGAGGGGGGGGYYGGGGACFSGAGGGSSYTDTQVNNVVHTQGFQTSDGMVILTYADSIVLTTISVQSCDSFFVENAWQTSAGQYHDTLVAVNNCDSIVETNLTINTTQTSTIAVTACDSFFVENAWQTSTGQYHDTLVASNNCDSIVETNLTINTTQVNIIDVSVCDSFFVENAWQTTTGQYHDTLVASNNCDSIVETNLTVNTVDATVTQNGEILTANETGATYQWVDCDSAFTPINGETNQVFTATSNGSYAVIVTKNGCTDTSTCMDVVTIGIREQANSAGPRIYPNPTTGVFTVKGNGPVQVFDLLGNLVLRTEDREIDLSGYPGGIYFVKVEELTRKLILAK